MGDGPSRRGYLSEYETVNSIREHLKWLGGELPSKRINIEEKDFSSAPIYHFYAISRDKNDQFGQLFGLCKTAEKRKMLLKELEDLLKIIKG
jgi:hypothetical protein